MQNIKNELFVNMSKGEYMDTLRIGCVVAALDGSGFCVLKASAKGILYPCVGAIYF